MLWERFIACYNYSCFPKSLGLIEWVSESHSVVSDSLQPHWLYSPWNSPGQNTGVNSVFLLQKIFFPTQGSNPGLLHCRRILYQLSHKGSPRIVELGSLSLLQWIFLTQESKRGLLHCGWILHQLSYQWILVTLILWNNDRIFMTSKWKYRTSG